MAITSANIQGFVKKCDNIICHKKQNKNKNNQKFGQKSIKSIKKVKIWQRIHPKIINHNVTC